MRVRWQWVSLLLMTLLTLTVWPAAGVQAQPTAGRDTVVIGMSQEPDYLNPMFVEMAAARGVQATIFVDDVQRDNTWKQFPQGVESMPSLKDGTWKLDGERMTLVWKVKARNWSDGKPVTCGDYVFGNSVARNEQVPVVTRDITNRIANVVCTKGAEGLDITVNWKERYAHANAAVTEYGAMPRHVLERYYRDNPTKLNQAPFGNDPKFTSRRWSVQAGGMAEGFVSDGGVGRRSPHLRCAEDQAHHVALHPGHQRAGRKHALRRHRRHQHHRAHI